MHPNKSEISRDLREIIKELLDIFYRHDVSNLYSKLYGVSRVSKINIEYDKDISVSTVSFDNVTERYQTKSFVEIYSNDLNIKLLQHRLFTIAEKFLGETSANSLVDLFCYNIFRRYTLDPSSEIIEEFIESILTDLYKDDIYSSGSFWISGFKLKNDSIKLADNIIIRRAQESDFKLLNLNLARHDNIIEWPLSILEISGYFKNNREFQKYYDYIINCLNLCVNPKVKSYMTSFKMHSILNSSMSHGTLDKPEPPRLILGDDLAEKFQYLDSRLSIDAKDRLGNLFREDSFHEEIEIALNRYQDSLESSRDKESKLALLVSVLESLVGESGGEATRRTCQRCAVLLESIGIDGLEVYNKMLTIYDLRSKYVHGSKFKDKDIVKFKAVFPSAELYTRTILVMFIISREGIKKANLVKHIDEAMVSQNKFQYLRHEIFKNISGDFRNFALDEKL